MEAFDEWTRKERHRVEVGSWEYKLGGLELGVELGSGVQFHELDQFVTQTQSQLGPNLKLSHASWTTSWAGVGVELPTVKPPIVLRG